MTVAIVRTEWSGTSGGPGLTQLAVMGAAGGDWNPAGTQSAVNAVRKFWDSLKGYLPDEVKLTVMPVIDSYDRISGDLVASHVAGAAPSQVIGTSAGGYAGGVGVKISWNTNQIRMGRRVRGSTFLVPLQSAAFGATGTVVPAVITQVNISAATLITDLAAGATPLGVWSRPGTPEKPRAGFVTEVVTGTCSQKSALMRGRRD